MQRFMKLFLPSALSVSLVITSVFLSSISKAASYEDYNKFLNRLGFENYSAQAKHTLDTEPGLKGLAVKMLEQNQSRYRVVDSARLLTLVIVEESFDRMGDPQVREKILNLTTYLLEPHPLITREVLPERIKNIKSTDQYIKARFEYLKQKTYERYADEKKTLLGAMLDLAPSQDVKDMEHLIDSYLRSKYMDWGLQQTRYWGRAMAASLVRYSRAENQPSLETDLERKLANKGLFLGNFITSTFRIKDEKQKVVAVKIYNGDFVNEHARASDSYFISIGVEPSDSTDRKFADANNLLGSKWEIQNYFEPAEERALLDKVRDRGILTAKEKKAYAYLQSNPSVSGYSHVGMIEIKKDKASGIEMPWVWDVYPNAQMGGVRFIGLEGFAYIEKFRKIGFVHYDAEKFQQYYVQKTKQQGFLPTVWQSFGAAYNDVGHVIEDTSKSYLWPSHISAADVKKLQNYPSSQADAWYANEVAPRVMKTLKSYLVSREALAFARNFTNIQNAAYCSQIFVLAFLQGVNVDPQPNFDRYSPLLTLVAKFHPSVPEYFKVSERIIAPSGFAWQSRVVEKHVMIELDPTWPVRDNAAMLAPLRPRLTNTPLPADSDLAKPPSKIVDFIEDNF